jgi:hypothetical protein
VNDPSYFRALKDLPGFKLPITLHDEQAAFSRGAQLWAHNEGSRYPKTQVHNAYFVFFGVNVLPDPDPARRD